MTQCDWTRAALSHFNFRSLAQLSETTLKASAFKDALSGHPNQAWVTQVLLPIVSQEGARIGCTMPFAPAMCKARPLYDQKSAKLYDNCKKGLLNGWLAGPWWFQDPLLPPCIVSPCDAVPKKHSSKMRSVHDLSAGHFSVNDFINKEDFSPKLGTFAQALDNITCGRGCWMAIIDVMNAFPHVWVHREDRKFYGFRVGDLVFIDGRLPFGSRSSPYLWQQVETALVWICNSKGVRSIVDYVDDHCLTARSHSTILRYVTIFYQVCEYLGIPVAVQKTQVGQRVVFLGLILDSLLWRVCLEPDSRIRLLAEVRSWLHDGTPDYSETCSRLSAN